MSSDWAASALSWWREAGVDVIVGERPRDWLAPAPPAVRESAAPFVPAATKPPTATAVPVEAMPDTLDAFQAWLLASDQLPFASRTAPRVGPSGDPDSGLMILVDMPAAADVTAGSLLSGEAGALFDRMMGAIGRSRETLYLAPLSPYRTPTGQIDKAGATRLAEIARHHIGLVAPRALLLFGDACSKALLGPAVDQTRGKWHEVDTKAGKIRTLVTIRPERLLSQPDLKKFAWEDLQVLREGLKP